MSRISITETHEICQASSAHLTEYTHYQTKLRNHQLRFVQVSEFKPGLTQHEPISVPLGVNQISKIPAFQALLPRSRYGIDDLLIFHSNNIC